MSLSMMIVLLVTSVFVAGAGLWLLLRRRRKSASELERERRLAVNAVGRMTDGTLLDAPGSTGEPGNSRLLFYRYSVAGVEYSAAQEIYGLRHVVRPETCSPGGVATVKYDPQNPYNSIVVCELWNGLGTDGRRESSGRVRSFEGSISDDRR